MKKNTAARSLSVSSLPQEIQVQIFVKLPLKSIGICRCVCRVWRSLFCNPRFIKTLLSHTTKHDNNPRLMLTGCANHEKVFCSIDHASVLSASEASSASSTTCTCHGTMIRDHPFTYTVDGIKYRILGSCDGLIFMGTSSRISGVNKNDNLCIWNPTTGEYKDARLPQCDFFKESDISCADYGFFYDSTVEFYKLVRISRNKNSGCYQFEVYTIGSESWEIFLSNNTCSDQIVFSCPILNGAIHCLGFKTIQEVSSRVIVSFDMSSKKFVDFIFPEEANPTSNESQISYDFLEVINDSLHMVIYSPSIPNRTDVWKMQEYGVRESWTKLFTLTTERYLRELDIKFLKLQWAFSNGEVLIEHGKSKFLYDPKSNEIKDFKIQGIVLSPIRSVNYVESLVSVNSGTYVKARALLLND